MAAGGRGRGRGGRGKNSSEAAPVSRAGSNSPAADGNSRPNRHKESSPDESGPEPATASASPDDHAFDSQDDVQDLPLAERLAQRQQHRTAPGTAKVSRPNSAVGMTAQSPVPAPKARSDCKATSADQKSISRSNVSTVPAPQGRSDFKPSYAEQRMMGSSGQSPVPAPVGRSEVEPVAAAIQQAAASFAGGQTKTAAIQQPSAGTQSGAVAVPQRSSTGRASWVRPQGQPLATSQQMPASPELQAKCPAYQAADAAGVQLQANRAAGALATDTVGPKLQSNTAAGAWATKSPATADPKESVGAASTGSKAVLALLGKTAQEAVDEQHAHQLQAAIKAGPSAAADSVKPLDTAPMHFMMDIDDWPDEPGQAPATAAASEPIASAPVGAIQAIACVAGSKQQQASAEVRRNQACALAAVEHRPTASQTETVGFPGFAEQGAAYSGSRPDAHLLVSAAPQTESSGFPRPAEQGAADSHGTLVEQGAVDSSGKPAVQGMAHGSDRPAAVGSPSMTSLVLAHELAVPDTPPCSTASQAGSPLAGTVSHLT